MLEEVVRLRDAIDGLAGLEAGSLSDDGLSGVLRDLHREKQRLCAEEARLMGSYDRRRAFADDGSKRRQPGWPGRRSRARRPCERRCSSGGGCG